MKCFDRLEMTTGRKGLVVILKEKAKICAIIEDRFIKLTKRIEVIEKDFLNHYHFKNLNSSS